MNRTTLLILAFLGGVVLSSTVRGLPLLNKLPSL